MTLLNATHDPERRSWVDSANRTGCDFPVQNLPYGRIRRTASGEPWRIGVAIGDQVLDLRLASEAGGWPADIAALLEPLGGGDLNALMAQPPAARSALRAALSRALSTGSDQQSALVSTLVRQSSLEMSVPCRIGDYTDFYTGIHHATTVGKLFRPDAPLMPNYKWVPIGYHGRASSVVVSGEAVRRPIGQMQGVAGVPAFGPCKRLDYELEMAIWVAGGNRLGESIPIDEAEQHLFGLGLLNDWSARDLQTWEYQPLGPFLAKSFATTVSPWIVTTEALAPFRSSALRRPPGDPEPLPYLASPADRASGGFDVQLEVWLQTARMRGAGEPAVRLSQSGAAESAYWTWAQLLTHHTVNGCNLQPGDLLGSGTLSGPEPAQAGSLLELSLGGKQKVTLANGERRSFLEDGDTVVLRAACERTGAVRIGFGEASGTVVG